MLERLVSQSFPSRICAGYKGGLCLVALACAACSHPAAGPPRHDAGAGHDAAVGPPPADGGVSDGGGDGGTTTSDGAVLFGSGGTWSFDEARGATAAGDPLHGAPHWTAGEIGTALQCDGAADSVEVGRAAIDPRQSFSVAAWLRLDRVDGAGAILALNG